MKSITKILLVSAVAVAAIAISAAPSEAAKRKAKAPAPCTPGMLCTAPNSGGLSKIMACGGDGKWYQAIFTPWCVTGTVCPAACS
jgi:hypothetical protein